VNKQVAQALRELYRGKRTGVLLCESPDAKRNVHFQSGVLVGARSSLVEDRLGEVMIRHGRINRHQFEQAAQYIKSGFKLGEILAQLHMVSPDDIEKFVRVQLLDIVCSIVITPPKRMVFTDLETVDVVVSPPVSVAEVLMEAARRTPRIKSIVEALVKDKHPLSPSSDPVLRSQDAHLSSDEGLIFSRIDGHASPHDIFSGSPVSEEHTARTLLGLLEAGIVELESEPAAPEAKATALSYNESRPATEARPPASEVTSDDASESDRAEDSIRLEIERAFERYQGQDHWEILELKPGASVEEINSAFQAKTGLYDPERFNRIQDKALLEKLSYIFFRVSEAHTILSTQAEAQKYQKLAEKEPQYKKQNEEWAAPPKKEGETEEDKEAKEEEGGPPTPTRSPDDAKALFAGAKKSYLTGDYWTTIQYCRQAIEIISDKAEYYHLLGLALQENPKWRQDAEKNFKIAASLDSWKPDYLISLGKLYQKAGMTNRAAKVFDQIRAIDPSFETPES
jgi:hypothetical protein